MKMATLAGVVHRPFGHKGRHTGLTLKEYFAEGFEQICPVGRFQTWSHRQRCFPDPGPRFAMQAFDRAAESGHGVHQAIEKIRLNTRAQQRVAKVARC